MCSRTKYVIPIANSLNKNFNNINKSKINFEILNNLNFTNVDIRKFPVIKILNKYPNYCSLFDTAMVSINDELINLFLNKKISFEDIFKNLIYILNLNSIKKLKKISFIKIIRKLVISMILLD